MSGLDRQVRRAQRRLWFNRWLVGLGWLVLLAAVAWTAALVAARMISAEWPLARFAELGGAAALLGSIVWLTITAESRLIAAEAVDEAAGLRERISTSLYCEQSSDPFARAVVQDAQSAIAGILAKRLIPLRWSRSMNLAMLGALVAAATFWLFPTYDLLGRVEAKQAALKKKEQVQITQAVLSKPVTAAVEIAEKHPELKDSAGELAALEKAMRDEKMDVAPDDMRREAIKKMDKLSDKLREKADSEKYASLDAMKKMLSQLGGEQADPKSQVGQLTKSLQSGDFAGAQEQIKKMQEQLAKRDHTAEGEAKSKELSQQLESLAKKLENMEDKKSAEKLKQAGVSEKDIKRVLDALNKKDSKQLEQLAKQMQQQLQKQGMTQQQAKKMMDQLKKSQKACQNCNKLGQKMSQAAKACKQGNGQQASQQMQKAGEQLNEMEKMSQELNELETQMAQMEDAKEELTKDPKQDQCEMCKGTGQCNGKPCPNCNGGKPGKGDGAKWTPRGAKGAGRRDALHSGNVAFQKKKADVKMGKGSVIAEWFVKGKQEKGETKTEAIETNAATTHDATDAIEKEEVPKIYQGAVKAYFDRIGEVENDAHGSKSGKAAEKAPVKEEAGAKK